MSDPKAMDAAIEARGRTRPRTGGDCALSPGRAGLDTGGLAELGASKGPSAGPAREDDQGAAGTSGAEFAFMRAFLL